MTKLDVGDLDDAQDILEAIKGYCKNSEIQEFANNLLIQILESKRPKLVGRPKEYPAYKPKPKVDRKIWRVIEKFPKYEMNIEGAVRNRRTDCFVRPQIDKRGGTSNISLRNEKCNSVKIALRKLHYSVWPEAFEEPGWITIESYPDYQINKDGVVRRKISKAVVEPKRATIGTHRPLMRLIIKGVEYRVPHEDLMNEVFGPADERLEWRPIPGFSFYEMSEDGDIRNIYKKVIARRKHGTLIRYHLRHDNKGYSKSQNELFALTFPELVEEAA